MTLWAVDPGGEKYLPFTKRKVLQWHDEMRRSGMRTLSRIILVDDNSTTIYVSILALQNDQWVDKIRITGGVEYKYIALVNVPPPTTWDSVEVRGNTQVAWILQGGQPSPGTPVYASVTVYYRYVDSLGVEQEVAGLTHTPSGSLGLLILSSSMLWDLDTGAYGGVGGDGLPIYQTFNLIGSYSLDFSSPEGVGLGDAVQIYLAETQSLYSNETASLVGQLTGADPVSSDVHDRVYAAHPQHAVTGKRLEDGEVVDFYYVSTENGSHVWGAFGRPPNSVVFDGQSYEEFPAEDDAQYLVPLGRVRYNEEGQSFTPTDPPTPAVLRDPVRDGDMVTWDWANLPDTVRLARPANDAYEGWSGNVVAVFRPARPDTGLETSGTGREAVYYLPQERDVRSVLNGAPATSDPQVTQTVFTAGATPQPRGYSVSEPGTGIPFPF